MRRVVVVFFLSFMATQFAKADPAPGLEGKWQGICTRQTPKGTKKINTSIVLDQQSGYINGKPIKNLWKNGLNVSFRQIEQGYTFSGVFSQDSLKLNGILSQPGSGKIGDCHYDKIVAGAREFCIRSTNGQLFYFKILDRSGNTQIPLTAVPPDRNNIIADPSGKMCWDINQPGADKCNRSLPLITYGCVK